MIVADCDPNGGDLAVRFGLSAATGWPALAVAARRGAGVPSLDPFLQRLPGGLEVLAGVRRLEAGPVDTESRRNVARALVSAADAVDVIVDAGRLLPGCSGVAELLAVAGDVVVVTRRDAASVIQLHDRVDALHGMTQGRLGLILVGVGTHRSREVERFTGLPVIGEIPDDRDAAAVASGESAAVRRMERSPIVAASRRIARVLADRRHQPDVTEQWDETSDETSPAGEDPAIDIDRTGGVDAVRHVGEPAGHHCDLDRRGGAQVSGVDERATGDGHAPADSVVRVIP